MAESDLIDRVDRDPKLGGNEKETTITMYGQDKRFDIFTAKPTVVKSLLQHDHFELDWARVLEGDNGQRVNSQAALADADGDIVAVSGKMPVGALTVKSKPRSNNHQSSIVSHETTDSSVFNNDWYAVLI